MPPFRYTIDRSLFWNQKEVHERGWSQKMIDMLLDECDETAQNPYYRSAPPQRLFLRQRVEAVERTPEFAAAQRAFEARSCSSRKAADNLRAALSAQVSKLEIKVRVLSQEALLDAAIESYNDWNCERGSRASRDDDRAFLERICVNSIRHELTRYDAALRSTRRKVGRSEANAEIRERVLDAIADAYPHLADECRRQIDGRSSE